MTEDTTASGSSRGAPDPGGVDERRRDGGPVVPDGSRAPHGAPAPDGTSAPGRTSAADGGQDAGPATTPAGGVGPRRLERAAEARLLTGVCGGIGRYAEVDPVVVRVGFAVLVLATFGVGILLYVAAFLLMGEETGESSVIENLLKRRLDGDAALALLGLLLSAGVVLTVAGGGLSGDVFVVVTLLVLVLLVAHSRGVDLRKALRALPDHLSAQPTTGPTTEPTTEPTTGPVSTTPTSTTTAATTVPPHSPAPPRAPAPGAGPPPSFPPPGTASSGAASSRFQPRGEMVDLARLAERGGDRPPGRPGTGAHAGHAGAAPVPRHPFLTPLTLFAALAAVAAMIPVAAPYPPVAAAQIMLAAGLAVVALGLVAGSLLGQGRGLIAVGTLLSLGLASTSVAAELPVRGHIGDAFWRPVEVERLAPSYRILAGTGDLDLTSLKLAPGERVEVRAEVSMGEMTVTVPRAIRVEVHARSGIGDIVMDEQLAGGVRNRVDRILPPEGSPRGKVPVIELHVRAGIGDVEVRRA